jgi:hypothetical protein
MSSVYDKAFYALLNTEEEVDDLLNTITKDRHFEMLAINEQGFMCVVPFEGICTEKALS